METNGLGLDLQLHAVAQKYELEEEGLLDVVTEMLRYSRLALEQLSSNEDDWTEESISAAFSAVRAPSLEEIASNVSRQNTTSDLGNQLIQRGIVSTGYAKRIPDRLVMSFFSNRVAAESAAKSIQDWDEVDDDIKLGAIAIMTLDDKGDLRTDKVGTKSGAIWGTAIGAAAGLLTGSIALIPGAVVGAALGAGLVALNHKSLGMTDSDRTKMIDGLKQGRAVVAVMADDFDIEPLKTRLLELGGTVDHYIVPNEAADVLAKAAAEQRAAMDAIDRAVDAATDEVQDQVEVVSRIFDEHLPGLNDAATSTIAKIAVILGGITIAEAMKLYDAGVESPSSLLEHAATPEGRQELAEVSGLDPTMVLVQAKKLDLLRVKGIGAKYAELLLAAGVDTVPDLATRSAGNLAEKIEQVNKNLALVDDLPTESQIGDWIEQAKQLPRILYY